MITVLASKYCNLFQGKYQGITTKMVNFQDNSLLELAPREKIYTLLGLTLTDGSPDICITSNPRHLLELECDLSYYKNNNSVPMSEEISLNLLILY